MLVILLAKTLLLAAVITAVWAVKLYHTENMVHCFETPDFGQTAGFAVTNLPLSDSLKLTQCLLLGKNLAHLELQAPNGQICVLRIAPSGESLHLKDFSERYQTDCKAQTTDFAVRMQKNRNTDALASWARTGFDYALYFPASEDTDVDHLTGVIACETRAVKAQ